jgi:SHS family lactate transporter-like MFS transporter
VVFVQQFRSRLSPTFTYLFLFRALLGIGMGAEWPAGAALAMETWPVRSRGFMGGVLQGSWGLGFMLSSAVYGLFYTSIGWRGMLWIGVFARPFRFLCAQIRQGAVGLAGEPTASAP